MSNNCLFTPYVQIRPRDIVIFTKYEGSRYKAIDFEFMYEDNRPPEVKALQTSNRPAYSYTFTKAARKKMLCALDCLILCTPARKVFNPIIGRSHTFQMSFITLTYSTDEIVDYLESIVHLEYFLKWLNRTIGATMYVWRLELQQRGQIHYHIVTDAFIRYDRIRDKWNSIQRNAGYIKRGMAPNSTDVKSAISVSDVSRYCAKYMAKEGEKNNNYTGSPIKKFYGCSKNLQGVKRPTFDVTQCPGNMSDLNDYLASPFYRHFNPSDYSTYISMEKGAKSLTPARAALKILGLNQAFLDWKAKILT